MLMTTTPSVEGKRIVRYLGVVTGETIIGANVFRDFLAGVRDFFGGRSASYEAVLREAKDTALEEMARQAEALGANAVVGIDLDYETVGGSGSMLMVTCSGTAVRVECRDQLFLIGYEILSYRRGGFGRFTCLQFDESFATGRCER